jgi:hypothetical protein
MGAGLFKTLHVNIDRNCAIIGSKELCLVPFVQTLLDMTSNFIFYYFHRAFFTIHKLHTNEMHYIFTLYSLFFNLYVCFGLYKAIIRGLYLS